MKYMFSSTTIKVIHKGSYQKRGSKYVRLSLTRRLWYFESCFLGQIYVAIAQGKA